MGHINLEAGIGEARDQGPGDADLVGRAGASDLGGVGHMARIVPAVDDVGLEAVEALAAGGCEDVSRGTGVQGPGGSALLVDVGGGVRVWDADL